MRNAAKKVGAQTSSEFGKSLIEASSVRCRYYLLCNNMCMGPAKAFPEYFPDEFDFDSFERRIHKHKKKTTTKCPSRCSNDPVPVAFDLGLNCEFTTHIPLGYAPTYLKSHEQYCGCREDLCPNKRSVASHEPCD